ncbi:hypothetical protein RRG08_033807 [Elysia crispata]|uniref:Uncharacterized protein n=1 Tax=Elysia crispata TaxID=231223 RepID=A0AAE0XUP2_9GAST|nr:hypothetical protein RRG08_033807 [Elysia crispata]
MEDKPQLCAPLETPVSYEENLSFCSNRQLGSVDLRQPVSTHSDFCSFKLLTYENLLSTERVRTMIVPT